VRRQRTCCGRLPGTVADCGVAHALAPDVCPARPSPSAVVRKEFQLIDINESDVNDQGAIASLMDTDSGESYDDMRISLDDAEYKGMREALKEGSKDVYVTVLEAMGMRKVLPTYVCK